MGLHLLELPCELRLKIYEMVLGNPFPEFSLDHVGWPSPLAELLSTCKSTRRDTIVVLRQCRFSCSVQEVFNLRNFSLFRRAIGHLGLPNHVERLRIEFFSAFGDEMEDRNHLDVVLHVYNCCRDARWSYESCNLFQRGDLRRLVFDVTSLPRWAYEDEPHLFRAKLMDPRKFENHYVSVDEIYGQLRVMSRHANKVLEHEPADFWCEEDSEWKNRMNVDPTLPLTTTAYSGFFGPADWDAVSGLIMSHRWKDEEDEMVRIYFTQVPAHVPEHGFQGVLYKSEMPEYLSLHRMIQKHGIELDRSRWDHHYRVYITGITIPETCANELAPAQDYSKLGPLSLSRSSPGSYYREALREPNSTQRALTKILTFAAEHRGVPGASVDFLPAQSPRRQFCHDLCQDLGLAAETVDGPWGKFVRMTVPTTPSC